MKSYKQQEILSTVFIETQNIFDCGIKFILE